MIWLYFQTEFYPWLRLVPWSSTAGEVLVTTVTKRGSQEMLCQYVKQLISTQVVYISNSWLLCECTLGYLEDVHNLSSEMTKLYYVLRSWHCMSLGLQTGNWQAVLWLLESFPLLQSWPSLDFQVLFTLTAANVAFGFWSHDIGGHTEPVGAELYTRYM